jgi:hypothetical protein
MAFILAIAPDKYKIGAQRWPTRPHWPLFASAGKLRETIRGVGPWIADVGAGYLGEPGRFKRVREMHSQVGSVAGQKQSGETKRRGRISKAWHWPRFS